MLSIFRPTIAAIALLTLAFRPESSSAQQSAQISVPVTIRVQPHLAIRAVVPGAARTESPTKLTSTTAVQVESNLPYRLAVRLAGQGSATPVRVLVRNANGILEVLTPGSAVIVALGRVPGQRGHEVACTIEAPAAGLFDSARCELVYEVLAEYHDTLLRVAARS